MKAQIVIRMVGRAAQSRGGRAKAGLCRVGMYLAACAEHLPKGKTLELFVPSFTLLKEQITHSHHCQGSVVFNTVHLSIALKGWSSWYIPGDGLMVRELPYLTQYIPPLGSLIWVFRFCLQDIWLKSQYKIEIVIWMLVGAQGPIMQGFSGLLAGWIKDLAGSLKNLNFTKFIQIQCFEGWHENIHLPYTHISPLGNHLVWVKISNLPTFPPGKFSTCRPGGWVEKNWEIIGLQNIHMGTVRAWVDILGNNLWHFINSLNTTFPKNVSNVFSKYLWIFASERRI